MAENRWSRIHEATSSLGEALMRIAILSDERKERAETLARQGRLDAMALERVELDRERLNQNARQTHAGWLAQGWTGTPGTQVWTPGQAPIDTGVAQADLGGLSDRRATEINPLAQTAMRGMGVDVEPGATYPGPSPISMGGDPSQFGAELMQTPQLGGDYVPGSWQDASYDPQLDPRRTPTYSVADGQLSGSGFASPEEATSFAAETAPGPTFNITGSGDLTAQNVPLADVPDLLKRFYTFDPSAAPSPARQASLTFVDSLSSDIVPPNTREWLNSLDDESLETWVANAEEERRSGLTPAESDRRAAATVDRVLFGYRELEKIAEEMGGAPGMTVLGSDVITRIFQPEDVERWRAASIMVVGGTLRWTSGAAISVDEIAQLAEALVPQVNEELGTAVFKMQGLEAQIGAMTRSANLASGRDYGERWTNVGIDRPPPTMPYNDRLDQLLNEKSEDGSGRWTDNQIEWFLTMEGY